LLPLGSDLSYTENQGRPPILYSPSVFICVHPWFLPPPSGFRLLEMGDAF